MDGSHSFPYQDFASCQYGDEFARTCLQHETTTTDVRNTNADNDDENIERGGALSLVDAITEQIE